MIYEYNDNEYIYIDEYIHMIDTYEYHYTMDWLSHIKISIVIYIL